MSETKDNEETKALAKRLENGTLSNFINIFFNNETEEFEIVVNSKILQKFHRNVNGKLYKKDIKIIEKFSEKLLKNLKKMGN